jgi:hypothetical protein
MQRLSARDQSRDDEVGVRQRNTRSTATARASGRRCARNSAMSAPASMPTGSYAAQRQVDAEAERKSSFVRRSDAAGSVGSDMDSLIAIDTCTGAGLKRLQANMLRFALGEPPLRLAGGETLASIGPANSSPGEPFKDSNYKRLLDDLITACRSACFSPITRRRAGRPTRGSSTPTITTSTSSSRPPCHGRQLRMHCVPETGEHRRAWRGLHSLPP